MRFSSELRLVISRSSSSSSFFVSSTKIKKARHGARKIGHETADFRNVIFSRNLKIPTEKRKEEKRRMREQTNNIVDENRKKERYRKKIGTTFSFLLFRARNDSRRGSSRDFDTRGITRFSMQFPSPPQLLLARSSRFRVNRFSQGRRVY